MTALTSDSDSSSGTSRRNDRDLRHLRRVPRFYHAPDTNDGSNPPFPPRIARTSPVHRVAPPRPLPTRTPALETHASCPPTTLNEDFSPPTTHELVDTITSAALTAVNKYLANIGLLPQTTPDSQPPAPSLARTMPDPPVLLETSAPAPAPRSTHYVENDTRYLQDSRPSHPLSMPPPPGFDNVFATKMQVEYRTLDTRRVPRVQPLQFSPHTDRTAATQLLVHSMSDALSGIFDVADPSGSVTLRSPIWVPGWHAPLLKLTKASIMANRDDTHTLHRLIDDLFAQLQERLASGVDGPTAFRTLLMDVTDYFDRAPRGAALETLQKFGVPSGTPFSNYLRSFRVVVASTVDKGGPLAPSPEMAMELIRIRTAQQYPMLMPTLFPGNLATRERPYASLATLWTVFSHLKHNTSPAIDGDVFALAPQNSSSYAHSPSVSPITSPHRNLRRAGRQDAAHGVFNVSQTHSRRDPFSIDYGLWPFDDRDYEIVCTVTNNIFNTELSLWTPLLSEDARRQACVQYRGRCCNCGSTEHSLRWCPAPFKNTFSLLNPEFGTRDPDGSVFETWKIRMRRWRQNAPSRGRQGNNRHNGSRNKGRPRHTQNREHHQAYHGNSSGMNRANAPIGTRNFPQRQHPPQNAPPATTLNTSHALIPTGLPQAGNHQHVPPYGQHNPTP